MRLKSPITLILLGDIAAGKGTQAKILAKKYGLKHIDTGAFSRKMAEQHKSFKRIKKGRLAPSHAIQNFLKSQIVSLEPKQGVLVDGGKMPAEARLVYKLFLNQKRPILVIYLTISQTESFRRALGRLQQEYRADDTLEALRNRIKYYRDIYSKTIRFWRDKKFLHTISGKGNMSVVNKRLVKLINGVYKD